MRPRCAPCATRALALHRSWRWPSWWRFSSYQVRLIAGLRALEAAALAGADPGRRRQLRRARQVLRRRLHREQAPGRQQRPPSLPVLATSSGSAASPTSRSTGRRGSTWSISTGRAPSRSPSSRKAIRRQRCRTTTACWCTSRKSCASVRRLSTRSCTHRADSRARNANSAQPSRRASTAASTARRCTRAASSRWRAATRWSGRSSRIRMPRATATGNGRSCASRSTSRWRRTRGQRRTSKPWCRPD